MQNLTIFLSIIFLFEIGFYTICAFQWYSYRPSRVIFHYAKKKWHLRFFFVPVAIFYGLNFLSFNAQILLLALILLNVANIFFWYKKLDKKLAFYNLVLNLPASISASSLMRQNLADFSNRQAFRA